MRHGWSIGLVFVLLMGCAKEKEKVSGWATFPVTLYTDPAMVATEELRGDFLEAMAYWEAHAGRRLFDYRGDWAGGSPYSGSPQRPSGIHANVIFFQNPWPFEANTAGMTTSVSSSSGLVGSMIMINPAVQVCSGECHGEWSRTSQRKLLAHELGHFIGLPHTQDPANIMYPSLAPGGSLQGTAVDARALQQVMN